jgi:hypothetical protein
MKTNYSNVKLPPNVVGLGTSQALSARQGITITRVTEHGRDDLVIERAGKPTIHLAWTLVRGGLVADSASRVLKVDLPAFAAPREDLPEEEEATGEPKNDQVRVTKRRGVAK